MMFFFKAKSSHPLESLSPILWSLHHVEEYWQRLFWWQSKQRHAKAISWDFSDLPPGPVLAKASLEVQLGLSCANSGEAAINYGSLIVSNRLVKDIYRQHLILAWTRVPSKSPRPNKPSVQLQKHQHRIQRASQAAYTKGDLSMQQKLLTQILLHVVKTCTDHTPWMLRASQAPARGTTDK